MTDHRRPASDRSGRQAERIAVDPVLANSVRREVTFEDLPVGMVNIAWSSGGTFLAASGVDSTAVWPKFGGRPQRVPNPRSKEPMGMAWHPSRPALAVAFGDGTVAKWHHDVRAWTFLRQLPHRARGLAWSPDGMLIAVTDDVGGVGIRDAAHGEEICYLRAHSGSARRPCWSRNGQVVVTSGNEGTIIVHDAADLQSVLRLSTASNYVLDIDLSFQEDLLAAGMTDGTVQIWDHSTGGMIQVLEGLAPRVACVRFTRDARFLAAMSGNKAIIWRCQDWEPVAYIGDTGAHGGGQLDFHPSEPLLAVTNEEKHRIDCYRLDYALLDEAAIHSDSRRYVNAKVMLLGDTGVGKSALGLRLSGQPYRPTDSTHGRNVWIFDSEEIDVPGAGTQTREVLLWDMAGQPGYRLVHQLHLNEVALALVIFDARSETNPFSGVKHWVRALAQAKRLEGVAAVPLRTYLIAARADRGGVPVTRERIQAVLTDLGIDKFFETSAKEDWSVEELAQAIRDGIDWESLPTVSSNVLFDSIRQFLLEEKEQDGRLLSTATDLFRTFRRARADMARRDDLRHSFDACIGRAESRDLITRLHFGDLVLLQPELLDSYASAMVQAAKEEPDGLGFIPEEDALEGRFRLAETDRVADRAQEKLLLIATLEELLRHEIALKETTDRGVDIIFPSQFTREQPDAHDVPGKQAVFTFDGPLRNIYARLAVRLSHSTLFKRRAMWHNTASYMATDGGTCGIHLRELEEGRGELALFYDDQAGPVVRAQFETYVLEYLQIRALPGTVTLRRILTCANCGYVLPDDLVRRKLERGAQTARCPDCEVSFIELAAGEPPAPTDSAVAEMNRSADMLRDKSVAAARLHGKIKTNDFDVFLCYNSRDRGYVTGIGERLKDRGLLPWLDTWEIPPGSRWVQELQAQLGSVKSAAVFIGPQGPGPWQELEVETLLRQFVKRKRPIIPVILAGRQGTPRLPGFLKLWHSVDMRNPEPDPFEQLIWGITGCKPSGTA